jgi:type IV pilus assembly protein PilY1
MHKALTLLRKAAFSVSIAGAVAFSSTAPATTLGLSDTPLFLAAGAEPNLIMAIDDSGSMDNEVLFPTNDGAAWWRAGTSGQCDGTDNNSFVGCRNNATGSNDVREAGKLNFNNTGDSSGTWKKYVYLFPNGQNSNNDSARRRSGDATNDHFAIPPLPAFAWARSPNHNKAYFNPKVPYQPWTNNEDYTFNNSSPSAARFDPVFETNLTMNLILDHAGTGTSANGTTCNALPANQVADNHYFKVYTGMTLPVGTCIRRQAGTIWEEVRTNPCQIGVNNGCRTTGNTNTFRIDTASRVAIRYYPATFFVANPATDLPTDFGYVGTTISGLAPDGTALTGYEIKSANFSTTAKYNEAIQNFANWFTYYRKRHQALRAGLGEAFSTVTGVRVDGFTINNRQNVTMGSINNATTRRGLYTKFYTQWTGNGGTPNRSAVAKMISEYKRTGASAPITASCQRNFGMLFTDGFSNSPANGDGINGVYGDEDSGAADPYRDGTTGVSATLADATFSAYTTNLRSDLETGRVSVDESCPAAGSPYTGRLDCNRNLHMNFFAVTLGARGLQFNPDLIPPQDPFASPYPTWPTSFPARHPSAVDDLWHATINGRGKLLNASSPDQIATQVNAVLNSIKSEPSTAASAALNSGSISDGSFVYQAQFQGGKWTGKLLSYSLQVASGGLDGGANSLRTSRLPAPDSRTIYTLNSAGDGVPFTWGGLSTDAVRVQQLAPGTFATEADRATEARRMLEYLRGSSTNEQSFEPDDNATLYRGRFDKNGTPNKLGDIVSSAPLYVGAPAFRYRDSFQPGAPYSEFVEEQRDRTPMVYVGANDGMLHAFYAGADATDTNRGLEAFAYIPGGLFPRLRELASQTYGHRFYVDGSPSMGDAYFNNDWHTIVAGGLNKGGQLVYALDVTDPGSFDGDSILWEFTDEDDPDLGYTYSQPSIVKLGDGNWYVVFGNGYNSMLNDDAPGATAETTRVSQTGNAVLFLVNIATKAVTKLDTGKGYAQRPTGVTHGNGLATPSVVDLNGDRRVDVVYAGDLYGNMWKFDVSAGDADDWNVAFGGNPLFVARNDQNEVQPITVRPEISRGPNGSGQVVLFGTGKYIETSDKILTPEVEHSFYGIYDMGSRVTYTTRDGTLLRQEILSEPTVTRQSPSGETIRTKLRLTSNARAAGVSGWYIDLVSPASTDYQGERQVTNPTVRNGAVIFTTLVPDDDPCKFGGTSWLMELDALTGSRLSKPPFDLNRDGQFTAPNDTEGVDEDGNPITPSGIGYDEIVQAPAIGDGRFGTEGGGSAVQYKYLPGSSGGIQVVIENPGTGGSGRQSWRQIR